uniref:SAP domain-containing protein n=1 Tax=Anabas testudineus TaxID=64144 RepID=A0A7N6AWN2_ANATE
MVNVQLWRLCLCTPTVLQLCLQQRRTREQLVEQGIMPREYSDSPLTVFHSLTTGNFLKHKLCSRPDRSQLVRMHILQETQAEPSLQATQMKLKRARLADDLNEKIAQRPGPMDLVEKNILHSSPLSNNKKGIVIGDKANYPKTPDVYKFDEDNSDALSPEQPASWETPSSTSASPRESGGTEADSTSSHEISRCDQISSRWSSQVLTCPFSLLCCSLQQSLHKLPGDKSRSKKSKEPKPRVKKLKYHQYIPPDQKQELNEVPMDSAYARLLQQQQQFLQLQILNQQQQQYNYHGVLPVTLKYATSSTVLSEDAASPPVKPHHTQTACKLDHLPANLDEMKVAELKMELKFRSLPVSGTKTDLIERLKLYQETSNIKTAAAMETTAVKPASWAEKIKLIHPVSPIASKVSSLGIEDGSMADSPAKPSDAVSPAHSAPSSTFSQRSLQEFSTQERSYEKVSEKDKRLHEKELQIEELMRKLEQEQRLVEELKMQLEGEKRSQQGESPPRLSPPDPIQVKEENKSPSNCLVSSSSDQTGGAVLVKQEEATDQSHLAPPSQFIISHQTIKQPQTLQSVQVGSQLLLTASSPGSVVSIQLPGSGIKLHTNVSSLIQTSGQVPLKIEASAVFSHFMFCPCFPEIFPFLRQDPSNLDKPLPVTASVTTLPINTVLSRPPPVVQVAQLPAAPFNPSTSLAALTSDTQLSTLLGGTLDADTEAQSLKLMEELHSPLVSMEEDFNENTPPPALTLNSTNMDNMDWLDLTLSAPGEGVNPMDMSTPVGIFSSDFLDSHDFYSCLSSDLYECTFLY